MEVIENQRPIDKSFPRGRRSCSAEASLEAELVRLRGLTVEQRINEALSIRDRFTQTNRESGE